MFKDKSRKDPTPYELLGIAESTRPSEITNKTMADALHKWGAKYTRQINEAFSKLRDPMKRLEVDLFLYEGEKASRIRLMTVENSSVPEANGLKLDLVETTEYDDIYRRTKL